MDHYIDFNLRPDPDFEQSFLMNALFAKFHRILVQLGTKDIGVSFPREPENHTALGDCLRVHGGEAVIRQLMGKKWLTGMLDHLQFGSIEPTPAKTLHRKISRVQVKSSAERLRKRHMKRHGVSYDEAALRIPDKIEQRVSLPYIKMKSQSTDQQFYLFINQEPPQERAVNGQFSSYGLSLGATVPWF